MDPARTLHLRDAVELAHALACHVAQREGIRALLIKGLVSSSHGLRPERVSADADVWVEPARMDDYLAALRQVGWDVREVSATTEDLIRHSVTLIHPEWPCDLDVHGSFPGFLADDERVFDALWERRDHFTGAGQRLAAADRASSVLITALHAMRTPSQTPRHGEEVRMLVDEVLPRLDDADRRAVLELAIATQAVDTARPVLVRLGLPLAPPTPPGESVELDEWRQRTAGGGTGTVQQWQLVKRRPLRERPALLWRAIWPPEAVIRLDHPELGPGRAALNRARLARLGRGLRDLPGALRGRRLARKGITDDSLLRDPGDAS